MKRSCQCFTFGGGEWVRDGSFGSLGVGTCWTGGGARFGSRNQRRTGTGHGPCVPCACLRLLAPQAIWHSGRAGVTIWLRSARRPSERAVHAREMATHVGVGLWRMALSARAYAAEHRMCIRGAEQGGCRRARMTLGTQRATLSGGGAVIQAMCNRARTARGARS